MGIPHGMNIAHGAISNNVEPLWIAKEQGIFRKYGLDVDMVFIIAGRAMQAMLAGHSGHSQSHSRTPAGGVASSPTPASSLVERRETGGAAGVGL